MGALQVVPDCVLVFGGHPARGDEEVENEVHHQQEDYCVEYLDRVSTTIARESESLRLTM